MDALWFKIFLAVGILLGRIGDVVSTRLATPQLLLEMNPIIRKGRWKFAWASLLFCGVPFLDPWIGVMFFVWSCLVAGSNFAGAWITRAIGEEAVFDLLRRAAQRRSLRSQLVLEMASIGSYLLVVALLMALRFLETNEWIFPVALGVLMLAVGGSAYRVQYVIDLAKSDQNE